MKKTSNLLINPKKGYGDILFGMTYDEVINLLGSPDEEIDSKDEDFVLEDDPISKTIFYDELGAALYFELQPENELYILESIDVDNEEAVLFGKKVFELETKELVKFIENETKEKGEVEEDEDFPTYKIIDFEEAGISLQFDNDELITVTIFNF